MTIRERPIVFSTEMVRAILDDRKTMTRGVVKDAGNKMHYGRLLGEWGLSEPPELVDGLLRWVLQTDVDDSAMFEIKCPYGEVGDIIWVKETWAIHEKAVGGIIFKARCPEKLAAIKTWRSSRFMPRAAARLFLKVKDVRVERLREITEADARLEGCIDFHDKIGDGKFDDVSEFDLTARDAFIDIWNNDNAKRGYGWDINPWVWVVSFERVEVPA